jgi:hypothetical protein
VFDPTVSRDGLRAVVVARRPRAWWYAAGAAAGCVYLYATDPTRATSSAILPCPFKTLTGLDCPVCGATRATWALLHAHPVRALGYNAIWTALVPFVVWAWWLELRGTWSTSHHPFRRRWFVPALVGTAVAFGVARNLPFAPMWSLHS